MIGSVSIGSDREVADVRDRTGGWDRSLGLKPAIDISKLWKVRYNLAALMIELLPRQGLITNYMPLSVP